MKKNICLISAFIMLLSSCSIHGSFEGLYSYYKKTKKETPSLLFTPDTGISICSITKPKEPKIFITNGTRLKKCIDPNKDVVFYIWKPNCGSIFCYSLDLLQKKCTTLNKELFVVAEYYDSAKMSQNYTIDRPIYGIDTKYYKTNFTSKYLSRFLNDLASKKHVKGSLIEFKNGVFYKSAYNIDSL